MSFWCDFYFTVTGDALQIERLQTELECGLEPEGARILFWRAKAVHRAPGYVSIHATRNHLGHDAISDLVSRFPDLVFTGIICNNMNVFNPGGSYEVFEGRDGEMRFTEHDFLADEVQGEIGRRTALLAEATGCGG